MAFFAGFHSGPPGVGRPECVREKQLPRPIHGRAPIHLPSE
jgi:hypothetical protein